MRKLKNIKIKEVSLVGKPANNKPFFLFKSEDEEESKGNSVVDKDSENGGNLKIKIDIDPHNPELSKSDRKAAEAVISTLNSLLGKSDSAGDGGQPASGDDDSDELNKEETLKNINEQIKRTEDALLRHPHNPELKKQARLVLNKAYKLIEAMKKSKKG